MSRFSGAVVVDAPVTGPASRAPEPYVFSRSDTKFFRIGKRITDFLVAFARALKSQDLGAIAAAYSRDFCGSALGFSSPRQTACKDGVNIFRFYRGGSSIDRAAAVSEWREYVTGFSSIGEVSLNIHELEKWRSPQKIVASVRFELIGKPIAAAHAAIDRAYLKVKLRENRGVFEIISASLIEGERVLGDNPQFVDVAQQAGVDFVNRYYPAFLNMPLKFAMIRYGPAGITAVDYDDDGFYDLFIPDGVESKLYRNGRNGTFEDVTEQSGLAGLDGVSVAVFADYDNDGFKDLFVSRTFRPNQLFHNNGDGTFTDVTAQSGLGEDWCTTVASWADYDNDGYLDLYVGRYLDPREDIPTTFYARNGLPNQLYHNNGDGTFTNVTKQAGVGDRGLCLGTVFGDYNDDGYPDLYVVNDFGRKTLYRNNQDGTFKDVTSQSGTLAYGAGMSASYADYDNDGKFDFYCTNIRSEFAWYASLPTVSRYMWNCWTQGVWKTDMALYWQVFCQTGPNFVAVFRQMAAGNNLLRNRGNGTFEDVTVKANANPVGWFWGSSFADFDNDGWQDLYLANGWVYNEPDTEIELEFLNNVVSRQAEYKTGLFFDPAYFGTRSWHGWERNRHLRSNGDGTFSEVGRALGTDLILNSRGVAVADFWNRGLLDIAVAASTDRHALLRNELAQARNWLQVELVGTKSNRDAIGARVSILADGKSQHRELVAGDGYGSQNSLRQHFGLADVGQVDVLTVRWPRSGITQEFRNVAANRIIEITEGKNELVEKHYQGSK